LKSFVFCLRSVNFKISFWCLQFSQKTNEQIWLYYYISLWAGLVNLIWLLGFFNFDFWKKKIWSKYTLGIVVSWYNLRNCNIWLLWHLSSQSFWSFLQILFSKTTQKKSKHYSGRAFLEVFGKCVGLGLLSSIQRPQKC
jgi:hypothetical protein